MTVRGVTTISIQWYPVIIADRHGNEFKGTDGETIKTNLFAAVSKNAGGQRCVVLHTGAIANGKLSDSGKMRMIGRLGTKNLWGRVDVTGCEDAGDRKVLEAVAMTGVIGVAVEDRKSRKAANKPVDDFDF